MRLGLKTRFGLQGQYPFYLPDIMMSKDLLTIYCGTRVRNWSEVREANVNRGRSNFKSSGWRVRFISPAPSGQMDWEEAVGCQGLTRAMAAVKRDSGFPHLPRALIPLGPASQFPVL